MLRPRSSKPPASHRIASAVATVLAGILGAGTPGHADSGTWITNASSTWSNTANWTGAIIADGATFTGNFNTIDLTTSNRTVTIDSTSRTLGTINIGDTSATDNRSYIIAASGGATLTFDNGVANAALNQGANSSGDTISAPVVLNSSLDITNASASTTAKILVISGAITAGTAGTKTISITGATAGGVTLSGSIGVGSGAVAVAINAAAKVVILSGAANTFTGGVTLTSGTLTLNSATALGASASALTINGGTLAGNTTITNVNAENWNGDFTFGGGNSLNLGTGAVTMSANRTITIGSSADTLTVGGAIGDGGSAFTLNTANLTGVITGILALGSTGVTNTYTGGTNINGGVVRFANGTAIPATGMITIGLTGALSNSGAHTTLATWLADAHLSTASTGALAIAGATSSDAFAPGANGHDTISLGSVVGNTATYTGTYAPGSSGYFAGGGGGTIIFSNTNAFTGANNLTAGNGGAGTVVITGSNDYSGTTTINAGTLQIGNNGATGAIVGTSGITNNATLAFNRTDTFTFDRSVSGAGVLVQRGTGTLVMAGTSNTYTGITAIEAGTLKIGATNTLPTAGAVTIGTGAVAGALDVSDFDQTVGSLSFLTTGAAATNTVVIGAGRRLTVNGTGSLQVGVGATAGITTNVTISGLGELRVDNTAGNLEVGILNNDQNSATNTATLNLSGLASFVANVNEFRVGFGSKIGSTLTLSNTANDITATTLRLSDSSLNNGTTSTILLGTGTNAIKANTIAIGFSKIDGTLKFASQTAGSAGTVTITSKTGGAANITVGSNITTGTAANFSALMDLRGHTANVTTGTLTLGILSQSSTGSTGGTLNFDAGTFTVNIVNIGSKAAAGTGTATGVLNIGGGTFTVNSGGTFTLATRATAGTASGTVNITGGTFNTNVNIADGGGTNSTSTLILDGGTLNMMGHAIGNGTNAIDVLNIRSGTLSSVSAINGTGGLTKTAGAGSNNTLILEGTNTYTGQTDVTAGTLLVNGSVSGSVAVTNAGSVLGGTGGTIGGNATLNAGTTLAPGASAGKLTVNGTTNLGANTTLALELNGTVAGTDYDQLATGGITLDGTSNITLSLGYAAALNDTFTVIDNTSGTGIGGVFANLADGGTIDATFGGGTWTLQANYEGGTTNDLVLKVIAVPEPGAAASLLGGVGMLLGLRRFRRRIAA